MSTGTKDRPASAWSAAALWPALRETLADRPDELALLEAMEAEHAAVDEVIAVIGTALADPGAPLGDLIDSLYTGLNGHLKHEEDQTLPLIGPDAPRLLPWLLDGATEEGAATMLAPLPPPARAAFTAQWQPAYAALDRWNFGT
ncbi:hemerythrin domain-containing protein [Actinomadura macrotermitis]|uniref:Hemerythrin-like domain-containing protein n=1 Tax=Actinomadura macrotermitis TaxID=2585200 RepID=A0A7K0C0V0_9ACTN|nr:hypothetical protein [Actinomadura macrotermitis]